MSVFEGDDDVMRRLAEAIQMHGPTARIVAGGIALSFTPDGALPVEVLLHAEAPTVVRCLELASAASPEYDPMSMLASDVWETVDGDNGHRVANEFALITTDDGYFSLEEC